MKMFEDKYNLGGNVNGGDEGLGLALKVNELNVSVPKCDVSGAYCLSVWAMIRHNSNFKTNCGRIKSLNKKTINGCGNIEQ